MIGVMSSEFDPIEVVPVAIVRGGRTERRDDEWATEEAIIELDGSRFGSDALMGLEDFSHLDVVFVFDQLDPASVETGARRPRGRTDMPVVGIFAQRASGRPNRLGLSTCELIGVEGTSIRVRGLDAIDGTPVLDMKAHVRGMEARGQVREPEWATRLMEDYW
jgi:tRNA-Thr(GGU) m(6)t(6)A37 methyltransferase TsaA